jgi:uncharacterized protein (DUF1800 family)
MAAPTTLPSDPFAPFQPTDAEPWDVRRASHLLRRAGLGPTPDSLDAALKLSPQAAVDSLLDFDVAQDPFNDLLDRMAGFFQFTKIEDAQGWCFFRMLGTPRPAQERMALFWHNRFATSASKVENSKYMHRQMETFRQLGLGSFRDLLLAVTHDPAMLVWLDGQSNRKGHANENYGREVMELFTLGIGNYTEKDVQQIARAFTGWQLAGDKASFNKSQWDDGEKEIFGQKGKFDSEAAVDLLLKQPAAPKFLATKILKEFVHPEPTDDQISHYAQRLLDSEWQIKPVIKEIFTSRLFYSDWAYRSRIKSPIELAVGGAVALGGKLNTAYLVKQTARMGQNILFPPNVKGWDGNEAWINANTVLVRFNFGLSLATQRNGEYAKKPDLEAWLSSHKITTAEGVVDHFASRLLDGQLSDEERTTFIDFLNHGADGKPRPFSFNHEIFNTRVRDLIHLMMSTPEYQLA